MQVEITHSLGSQRRWLGITGLLLVTGVFTLVSGPLGMLIGGVLAVSWWQLTPEYAFTLGQFGLVAAFPDSSGATSTLVGPHGEFIVLGELGLIALLLAPPTTESPPLPGTVLGGMTVLVAGGAFVSWGLIQTPWINITWLTILGLAGSGLVMAYSLQQYERWWVGNSNEAVSHE